tara:strand:- start:113 stop:376 length:264 start_codon:yes stop_codon:yes gene_type:complete
MILFKQRNKKNLLGWDFILKTDTYYIEFDIKNNLVAMISYTNRKDVSDEDKYEDYEMVLDEDYDIVAYCNDIKIVLNQKFLLTDKEQ